MRRFFWLVVIFAVYFWISLTGNEEMVIHRGKLLYRYVVHWFEDAELDFHLDEDQKTKKKHSKLRRWD